MLRLAAGRSLEPSAAVLDRRTLRASPESGERAGDDGAKRKRGAKLHLAVDTLGYLLALHVTPADQNDRAAVGALATAVQAATKESVDVAFVDQGVHRDVGADVWAGPVRVEAGRWGASAVGVARPVPRSVVAMRPQGRARGPLRPELPA